MIQSNGSNIFEKQVEKAALAVCLLLFLYGLFHWGLSSPRSLNGKGLDQVDEDLWSKAQGAKLASDNAKSQTEPLNNYDGKIATLRNTEFTRRYALSPFGPPSFPLKVGDATNVTMGKLALSDLLSLPKPPAPEVKARLELPNTGEDLKDARASHGVLLYPWEKVVRLWEEKLGEALIPPPHVPVVVAVQLEVQEKLPNGTWSDPRSVETAKIALDEAVRQEWDEVLKKVRSFDGGNADEVRRAAEQLGSLDWQQWVLAPAYWDVWDPKAKNWADWKRDVVTDDLLEEIRPKESKTTAPSEGSAPRTTVLERPRPQPTATPRLTTSPRPRSGYRRGMTELSDDDWQPGRGKYNESELPFERFEAPAETGPKITPITPHLVRRDVAGVSVPPLREQYQAGKVLVWFHDTVLEEMKVYRYRLRLELVNPLLTWVDQARTPEDAKTATISTPWSDWSKEVSVPKSTVFFLTGAAPHRGEARVTVFTRSLGEPVRGEFYVKPGDPIGEEKQMQVMSPVEGVAKPQTVNFFTGAIAVDFDFGKSLYGFHRSTVEMFYLDEKGILKSRVHAVDEGSKEYRDWIEATRAPSVAPAAVGR